METAPWTTGSFEYPDGLPTMISEEEKQYLYWLTSSVWTGRGHVAEIGPWLGGSTVCLAAGMQASGRDASKKLMVYDNFLWRDFMSERALLPVRSGESFYQYFLANTRAYEDIIDCSIRALPDERIEDEDVLESRFHEEDKVPVLDQSTDGCVEILFVDGAKSWRAMSHLLRVFAAGLTPNVSYLVWQDFKYWRDYWVPGLMGKLWDNVEPVHNVLRGTTVTFRLTRPLSTHALEGLGNHVLDLPWQETLRDLERACAWLRGNDDLQGAANVELCKVRFLAHQGRLDAAARVFEDAQQRWRLDLSMSQLEQVRDYLRRKTSHSIPRPIRLAFPRFFRRLAYIQELLRGHSR